MAFAGRDSPFPSGPSMSCAVSSGAQQPRADIFSALLKQPCLLADALITSSGEMLSRSSSTGMLPRPHPVSRAPPRSPQRVGRPGNTGRGTETGEAAPCPMGREAEGSAGASGWPRFQRHRQCRTRLQHHGQRSFGWFSTTDSARGRSNTTDGACGVSAPRTASVGVQHHGQRPPRSGVGATFRRET